MEMADSMQQSSNVLEELIVERAIRFAHQSGWMVVYADCHVQVATSEAFVQRRTPDTWLVLMTAQPFYNATLKTPMPLGCRVQQLDGQLHAVSFYEPSDREQYLG